MEKLYTIICHDKPDVTPVRKEKLLEHLAHIENVMDEIMIAGPLYDEEQNFVGSLLVVKADTAAAARQFLEQDPYYQAGIWKSIEIRRLSSVAGEWVGGKTW